ncbi:MAG: biosynthetic peptidoglycan transglycosylase [Myxococcota bacterium]
MRKVAIAGIALVLLVLAVPALATAVLGAKGVAVGHARWCATGLCFRDLVRGELAVATAELRWDRSLALASVRTPPPRGGEGGKGSLPLTRVDVTDLVVTGTPLPPLSGELFPARRLAGEGVTIDGDVVHATLPTEHGVVVVRAQPDGDALAVEASCDCVVRHAALANVPWAVSVRAKGRVEGKRFAGKVRVADVPVEVDATSEDGVAKGAAVVDAPIADVYAALGAIVPEARAARIGGRVRAEVTFAWPGDVDVKPTVEGFTVDGLVGEGFTFGSFTFWGKDPEGVRVLARGGEGTPDWTPLGQIGPWLPSAVIAAEDVRFRAHPGYDVEGMLEADAANEEKGEIVRGGSTLTQQLAKNLFLDGERTYARKLRELLYAVEMERELGKQRILELYLNVVEWGPGIRGARQAARAYFLKSPQGLLPEEAAFLAGILRNPRTAWRTQYLRGRPDMGRVGWILGNMGVEGEGRVVRFVPP